MKIKILLILVIISISVYYLNKPKIIVVEGVKIEIVKELPGNNFLVKRLDTNKKFFIHKN